MTKQSCTGKARSESIVRGMVWRRNGAIGGCGLFAVGVAELQREFHDGSSVDRRYNDGDAVLSAPCSDRIYVIRIRATAIAYGSLIAAASRAIIEIIYAHGTNLGAKLQSQAIAATLFFSSPFLGAASCPRPCRNFADAAALEAP
ncbi:hypothetical protein [Bradyrhizobium liaoningense]